MSGDRCQCYVDGCRGIVSYTLTRGGKEYLLCSGHVNRALSDGLQRRIPPQAKGDPLLRYEHTAFRVTGRLTPPSDGVTDESEGLRASMAERLAAGAYDFDEG
jgi:hypothetical protein